MSSQTPLYESDEQFSSTGSYKQTSIAYLQANILTGNNLGQFEYLLAN